MHQTFFTDRGFGSMGLLERRQSDKPSHPMWLGEAQIGLMLETSLVHAHTIVRC